MLDGETIQSGAAQVCEECKVRPLERLAVQRSSAGFYVGTTCDCGPYSPRERLLRDARAG